MREVATPHEPIGVSRNVIKMTPNRLTALWLFGTFIIASVAFVSTWIGYFLFGGFTDLTYAFGFGVTLFVCSMIGWFTIIIQENAQDLKIKIIHQ
jgi:zinc transporter ZupT